MQSLEQEVNRIRNELADIGCEAMFGKTCGELVQCILSDIMEQADTRADGRGHNGN